MPVPARLAAVLLLLGPGFLPAQADAAPAPPPARPSVPLAAHRALYELTKDNSVTPRGGREIAAAHGTMGYEVVDVCDGWATRQRLNMTITDLVTAKVWSTSWPVNIPAVIGSAAAYVGFTRSA